MRYQKMVKIKDMYVPSFVWRIWKWKEKGETFFDLPKLDSNSGFSKGQLISKGNFSVFNSPKKRTRKC
jgi:hypothetical protein